MSAPRPPAAMAEEGQVPGRVRPCVVHLVREANGFDPFRRFIDSYAEHDAGVEHELVLLFKGFPSPDAAAPYRDRASALRFEEVFVDDRGFDLDAYLAAAARLSRARYCFINSFSRIRAPGWLAALSRALDAPGVGLSGATGSWASAHSYLLFDLHLPSAYGRVFPDRAGTRARMRSRDVGQQGPAVPALGAWRRRMRTLRQSIDLALAFPPFPTPHLRTNAFMVTGDVLAGLDVPQLRQKLHTYRMESGRRSITRQVERMALRAVVVGRDGVAYDVERWAESETFWQGRQANLLISDNQTAQYEHGDMSLRELLAHYAWGDMGRPMPG